jgi:hypothetical protein
MADVDPEGADHVPARKSLSGAVILGPSNEADDWGNRNDFPFRRRLCDMHDHSWTLLLAEGLRTQLEVEIAIGELLVDFQTQRNSWRSDRESERIDSATIAPGQGMPAVEWANSLSDFHFFADAWCDKKYLAELSRGSACAFALVKSHACCEFAGGMRS